VEEGSDRRRPPGSGRGLWLVAIAALVILFGGGAAVWSLLRELQRVPVTLEARPPSEGPSPSHSASGTPGATERPAP
jgi:hypothetical protein